MSQIVSLGDHGAELDKFYVLLSTSNFLIEFGAEKSQLEGLFFLKDNRGHTHTNLLQELNCVLSFPDLDRLDVIDID